MVVRHKYIKIPLDLLSFEAAEELEKLRLGKRHMRESTKNLAKFFQRETNFQRIDYQIIFKEAHFPIYEKEMRDEEEIKAYASQISNRLSSASKLETKALEKLIKFCIGFADHCEAYGDRARYSY